MNAISARPETRASFAQFSPASMPNHFITLTRPAPAEWLPAPPPRRQTNDLKPQSANSVRSARVVSIGNTRPAIAGTPNGRFTERFFLGLLAGAAVVAITYGFSCMADLVQNWALFNAGVERLIQ